MNLLRKTFLFAFMLLVVTNVMAQTVKGVVIDKETNEPLIGVAVLVQGTSNGYATDEDGSYTIKKVSEGSVLEVSYFSYKTLLSAPVNFGGAKEVVMNFELESDSFALGSVMVTARKDLEIEAVLTQERINSNVAIENMGAKEMSLKGISNVEDGVKQITGISIEDAGQVFVRGLGDRYSLTTMNGLPVASPNPDNKLIPLDLFPSSVVKNITVSKVYMVSAFADYSGALIDIATKDIADEDFLSVSLDFGGTIGTTFKDFYVSDRPSLLKTSKLSSDVKGFANDPVGLDSYLKENNPFNTDFSVSKITALPDFGFGISAGKTWQVADRDLNLLVSLNADKNSNTTYGSFLTTLDADGNVYKTEQEINDYEASLNTTALASLSYELSNTSKIGYSMFYSRSAEDKFYDYWCNRDDNAVDIRGRNSVLHVYKLLNNQIYGVHDLSERLELNWSASYANTSSDEPDRRQTLFRENDGSDSDVNPWVFNRDDAKNTMRYFGELNENEIISKINFKYILGNPENDNILKIGFNSRNKDRQFDSGFFSYNFKFKEVNPNTGISTTIPQTVPNIYDVNGVLNQENIAAGKLNLDYTSLLSSYYEARSDIYAGFAELNYNVGSVLFNVGVRYEHARQGVTYASDTDNEYQYKEIKKGEIFPALNIKWALKDQHSVRFAASKTITRPSFVEMAPFKYKESGSSMVSVGNENIENGYNYNVDVRYEFFKEKSSDMLSLTGYYKYLDNPIERVQRDAGGDPEYSYDNSEKGLAAGVEFEARKELFKGFRAGFNASYIYTNVKLQEGQGIYTETSRQLQGASPYLVNADLTYQMSLKDDSKMSYSLVYNLQGPRIDAVGIDGLADVMQEAYNTLNFNYAYQINPKFSIKAKFNNLLSQKVRFTQHIKNLNETITVGEDRTYRGATIGLTYKF